MTSMAGRYPCLELLIKANFSLCWILSRTSATFRSPSTTSKSASAFPCRSICKVSIFSSLRFPSKAAAFSNERLKFPNEVFPSVHRGAPVAIVAVSHPGKLTDQLFVHDHFRCSSKSGRPESSRNSRHERSVYLRPVTVNCGVPSSSVILYATAEWGLPNGLSTRVVFERAMYWLRKAISRSGDRRVLRGLQDYECDSLALE